MKNRIAKSAAGSETQHSTDWPSDASLAYYEQFAKGGVGMICFETSDIFGTGLSMLMVSDSGDASAADAPGGAPADGVEAEEVTGEGLTIATSYGTEVTVPFDTLVVATAPQKNRDLYDELVVAGAAKEINAVGDCYAPGTIANATARANVIARRLGNPDAAATDGASAELAEGEVYTATATGIGDVTVSVSVKDGAIVDAAVDTSNETAGVGRDLGEGFADEIREKGAVDAASGATLTSNAAAQALADCLAQAGLA